MIFSLVTGSLTNMIFSMLYPNSQSIGGSPVVFSLIALMAVLQVVRKDLPGFNLKYSIRAMDCRLCILSNIPVFSKNSSTLVIHSIRIFCGFYIRDYRNENKSYLAAQRLGYEQERGFMDIRILLEVLDTRQNQYKYTGPMEGQVYGVQVQNGSYSYLEGMLYVQPSLTHPRPPKNTCVIAGETDLL